MGKAQGWITEAATFGRAAVGWGRPMALLVSALAFAPSFAHAQKFNPTKPPEDPACPPSKFIDLTHVIENSPPSVMESMKIEIHYKSHEEGAAEAVAGFGQFGLTLDDLRNGEAWATETFTRLGTHDSTHIDAPWHYNSEIGGVTPMTADEMPLEWFFNDGVKLDMSWKGQGDAVTVADIQRELDRIDYELKPMDIVLIYTGRDAFYYDPLYMHLGPGVTAEATKWLTDQGVRVMGIDQWGWDRPLYLEAIEAGATHEPGTFWAAHQIDVQYAHMERLVNLRCLPAKKFTVAAFPMKVKGASGAPARVVAILKK